MTEDEAVEKLIALRGGEKAAPVSAAAGLSRLNEALFRELSRLETLSGKEETAEAVKRVAMLNGIAGRVIEIQRLKLDTVKAAVAMGCSLDIPAQLDLRK